MLDLARDISARAGALDHEADIKADLEAIVAALGSAYAPDAALATALRGDWLRGRGDKTARLALAWAREQVSLALSEVLQHARAMRAMRADGDVDTLAWLWLAACEALAYEPSAAASDRAHALLAFLRST